MKSFDSLSALPRPGSVLNLAASAGTGKTWVIAALAARYVIEAGYPVDHVMAITFSRASTEELRDRVRSRFEACADAIRDALENPGPATTSPTTAATADPVIAALRQGSRTRLEERLERADTALRDFDRAAIFTTHGFCDGMLTRLGVLVDHDPADRLLTDATELAQQASADLYVGRYAATGAPFPFPAALRWVKQSIFNPTLDLAWSEAAAEANDFTAEARRRVDRTKRRLGRYTYDDMLSRLRDALADEATGEAASARLAATYPVVLVDEFQDTDPLQWEILQLAFVNRSALVLIGDPKQSIYGFRGADVEAYIAASASGRQASLDTNRRSDPRLVRAVQSLIGGRGLGHSQITADPVLTSDATPRLVGAEGARWEPPLRLRTPASPQDLPVDEARRLIDADLAADITALLTGGPRLLEAGAAEPRALRADDIAVIVSTNRRGQDILAKLTAAGLPAVFTGAESVFASPAAEDWLSLLRATAEPRTGRVRAAALTDLIGWTLADLTDATADHLADLAAVIRQAAGLLAGPGPAATFEWLADQTSLARRLAGGPAAGRTWTDLRHLAELLQGQHSQNGAEELLPWLEAQLRRASGQTGETPRRVESDGGAISMLTVHQAKGLQFPIVYLPQAADRHIRDLEPDDPFSYHDETGRRWLDLGRPDRGPGQTERARRHQADEDGESLRHLYVALTRATCQVTVWWMPTLRNTSASPLHRLLFAPLKRRSPLPAAVPLGGNPRDRADAAAGVVVQTMDEAPPTPAPALPAAGQPPHLRRFSRAIDLVWQRTSYSALTAGADHDPLWEDEEAQEAADLAAAAAEETSLGEKTPATAAPLEAAPAADAHGNVTVSGGSAEPTAESGPGTPPTDPLEALSPMAGLPGGAGFGSLVHAVFEYADPGQPDQFRDIVTQTVVRSGLARLDPDTLVAALQPGLTTPLGPIADGASLAGLPLRDRLAELAFEMPLALDGQPPDLAAIAGLLDRHLPPSDPLAAYPERLRRPDLPGNPLRGFLTGSIDAVLRIGQPARYIVVDYKTNRLAPPDTPLRLRHYTAPRLAEAMMASHYPLQALLYSVALHRFLRWRLPDYDPGRHFGGIAYLFVRGMAGPDTPIANGTPCGVFAWRPAIGLVGDLDDLLAGRLP
ncbi:MAG: UvrD-helicase domain-containing protein [Propionibacteriaceae bacterium]|jgi:exodeoxyribonuclease V beta subunit|nr:UvrD-helicase domain-containing protein [Propionibacteriaceae bacterium]